MYMVSDEKLKAQGYKVVCTKCRSEIIVKSDAAEAPEEKPSVAGATAPKVEEAASKPSEAPSTQKEEIPLPPEIEKIFFSNGFTNSFTEEKSKFTILFVKNKFEVRT
jgi:hypothetical protein